MTVWRRLYLAWAALAVVLSVASTGLSPENATRLGVMGFLLGQLALRKGLVGRLAWLPARARFVVYGTLLAAAVEGFHMISTPVFPSLRVTWETTALEAVSRYLLDLVFTLPAYLVVFAVIWWMVERWSFTVWEYALVMGLGQTLGDGGLWFFAASPGMLAFLPYPMTNYHAMNVVPFLATGGERRGRPAPLWKKLLAVPILVATYFLAASLIKLVGRRFGLE